MTSMPSQWLFADSVSVQTLTGHGAYGPVYATAATKTCKVSITRQLVRNAVGAEVVSEMTIYAQPADEAAFAPESLVTFAGRTSQVITASPCGRPGETQFVKVTCS